LSKSKTADSKSYREIKEAILETVRKRKPETVRQLFQQIPELSLSDEEVTKILIELENEGRLHFTKKEHLTPATTRAYLLSREAGWFWVILAFAIASTIAVFTISDNASPIIYVRSTLGVVFVLFLPGFAFMNAMFPARTSARTDESGMGMVEYVALSLVMSLALTAIMGLIMNYSPWGVNLSSVFFSLLGLTLAFATVAIFRVHRQFRDINSKTSAVE
jgi:hypothetical protein